MSRSRAAGPAPRIAIIANTMVPKLSALRPIFIIGATTDPNTSTTATQRVANPSTMSAPPMAAAHGAQADKVATGSHRPRSAWPNATASNVTPNQIRIADRYVGLNRARTASDIRMMRGTQGSALSARPRRNSWSNDIDPAPATAYQPNKAIQNSWLSNGW